MIGSGEAGKEIGRGMDRAIGKVRLMDRQGEGYVGKGEAGIGISRQIMGKVGVMTRRGRETDRHGGGQGDRQRE